MDREDATHEPNPPHGIVDPSAGSVTDSPCTRTQLAPVRPRPLSRAESSPNSSRNTPPLVVAPSKMENRFEVSPSSQQNFTRDHSPETNKKRNSLNLSKVVPVSSNKDSPAREMGFPIAKGSHSFLTNPHSPLTSPSPSKALPPCSFSPAVPRGTIPPLDADGISPTLGGSDGSGISNGRGTTDPKDVTTTNHVMGHPLRTGKGTPRDHLAKPVKSEQAPRPSSSCALINSRRQSSSSDCSVKTVDSVHTLSVDEPNPWEPPGSTLRMKRRISNTIKSLSSNLVLDDFQSSTNQDRCETPPSTHAVTPTLPNTLSPATSASSSSPTGQDFASSASVDSRTGSPVIATEVELPRLPKAVRELREKPTGRKFGKQLPCNTRAQQQHGNDDPVLSPVTSNQTEKGEWGKPVPPPLDSSSPTMSVCSSFKSSNSNFFNNWDGTRSSFSSEFSAPRSSVASVSSSVGPASVSSSGTSLPAFPTKEGNEHERMGMKSSTTEVTNNNHTKEMNVNNRRASMNSGLPESLSPNSPTSTHSGATTPSSSGSLTTITHTNTSTNTSTTMSSQPNFNNNNIRLAPPMLQTGQDDDESDEEESTPKMSPNRKLGFQRYRPPSLSEVLISDDGAHYNSDDPAGAQEIIKGLYLGPQTFAANFNALKQHKITHILIVARNLTTYYPEEFEYLSLPHLKDNSSQEILSSFPACFEFIDRARKGNNRCLIHCKAGISRSPTVVISYLMARFGYDLYQAYELVRGKRNVICPNLGFVRQLKTYNELKCNLEGHTATHLIHAAAFHSEKQGTFDISAYRHVSAIKVAGNPYIKDPVLDIILTLPNVNYLDLSNTDVSDHGTKQFTDVDTLQRVELRGTKCTDQCVMSLLKTNAITHLSLPSNTTNLAAEAIANNAKNIKHLDIAFTNIDKHGVIDTVKQCTQLEWLCIAYCKNIDYNDVRSVIPNHVNVVHEPSEYDNRSETNRVTKCRVQSNFTWTDASDTLLHYTDSKGNPIKTDGNCAHLTAIIQHGGKFSRSTTPIRSESTETHHNGHHGTHNSNHQTNNSKTMLSDRIAGTRKGLELGCDDDDTTLTGSPTFAASTGEEEQSKSFNNSEQSGSGISLSMASETSETDEEDCHPGIEEEDEFVPPPPTPTCRSTRKAPKSKEGGFFPLSVLENYQ